MDSKSASKKLPTATEQGAVIKFSMPAGPESDEFYSNLVRKFGQDAVSRTVKENCSAMSPRSRASSTGTVCSLTKIEAVNDSFHQQLTATLKQDIDRNFVDFLIAYLLSSDKDGQPAADVDKLIQHYVKHNPQLREQLVNMLKNLAEAKEIRIEPSQEIAVIPKKSAKVKNEKLNATSSSTSSTFSSGTKPGSPGSSRSPSRHSASSSSSSDVITLASAAEDPTTTSASSKASAASPSDASRSKSPTVKQSINLESPKSAMAVASKLKVTESTSVNGQEPTTSANGLSTLFAPPETAARVATPPTVEPSNTAHVGYVRVVGATSKALELLRLEEHPVDGITIVNTTPRRIDDSDCDEVFQFAGCTYDALVRLESAGAIAKKKKKRNKKKNKKKNQAVADGATAANGVPDVADVAEDDDDDDSRCDEDKSWRFALLERAPPDKEMKLAAVKPCGHQIPTTSSGHTTAVLAITKPLRLVKDIETRAPIPIVRSDILLDKEFKFQSVSQAECGVVTSWDDLKELVAEVFPNDSELQEAFASKAHNSLDLWKFIVKYGRMYKDFVSEVLEMVNELKKGLIDAMDMHREKTNEILETHKKEMCAVVEKARAVDSRIEELEKELEEQRVVANDQKVKAFTQDEEIQKLQKNLIAKEKRIRDFDNVKKDLLIDRNRSRGENVRLAADLEKNKSELSKFRSECDSLRSRLKRSIENAQESDYKLRELEGKLSDERVETQKLKDANSLLTKKTESLQSELARLKEQQAKQRKLEMANQAAPTPPLNVLTANSFSSDPLLSSAAAAAAAATARTSFFTPSSTPVSVPASSLPYASSLNTNTNTYLPSPARVVGPPSRRLYPQTPQSNSQPSTMRSESLSLAESVALELPRTSYAAASAGVPGDAFGGRLSYRDSAAAGVRARGRDCEVHSLLTPNDPPLPTNARNEFLASNAPSNSRSEFPSSNSLGNARSGFSSPNAVGFNRSDFPSSNAVGNNRNEFPSSTALDTGARPNFDDSTSELTSTFRDLQLRNLDPLTHSSQPSYASFFSSEEPVSYSPWGNATFDFSAPSVPIMFNITPSSLASSRDASKSNSPPGFSNRDRRTPSDMDRFDLDQNSSPQRRIFNNPGPPGS